MNEWQQRVEDNVRRVRERIARAAERSGRRPADVTLVAVTKYVDSRIARQLLDAGCHDLAESRPQQLWEKAEQLADQPVRWHLVGHLQRNKIRRTLPLIWLLHSGDNARLLDELDKEAARRETPVPLLLEVNISGEAAKHGFEPDDVERVLEQLDRYQWLSVRGLMTMAHLTSDLNVARADFAALRQLRDRLVDRCPPGHSLDELSMGMSGDFEEAIAEGATMVRVGSALFEGVLG